MHKEIIVVVFQKTSIQTELETIYRTCRSYLSGSWDIEPHERGKCDNHGRPFITYMLAHGIPGHSMHRL